MLLKKFLYLIFVGTFLFWKADKRLQVIKGTQKYERMIWEKGAVAVPFLFPVSSHFIFASALSCRPYYLEACNG